MVLPDLQLTMLLGSIVAHVDEGISPNGHAFDIQAASALVSDPRVQAFLDQGRAEGLLPLPRAPR